MQRVPATEAQGRIHTSTATVAVLPEAEEVDFELKPEDLRIEVCRSGGPGGQGVNTTDSAVQVMYIPTGRIVRCQDGRSQQKNKEKALKYLARSTARGQNSAKRKRNIPRLAKVRSVLAAAKKKSVPTIFRKTASPITASASRSTISTASWKAISMR